MIFWWQWWGSKCVSAEHMEWKGSLVCLFSCLINYMFNCCIWITNCFLFKKEYTNHSTTTFPSAPTDTSVMPSSSKSLWPSTDLPKNWSLCPKAESDPKIFWEREFGYWVYQKSVDSSLINTFFTDTLCIRNILFKQNAFVSVFSDAFVVLLSPLLEQTKD